MWSRKGRTDGARCGNVITSYEFTLGDTTLAGTAWVTSGRLLVVRSIRASLGPRLNINSPSLD